MAEAFTQARHELTRRDQIRENHCRRRTVQHRVFNRANQQRRGGVGWNYNDAVAGLDRGTSRRESNHRVAERLQIGHSDETGGAGAWTALGFWLSAFGSGFSGSRHSSTGYQLLRFQRLAIV